MNKATPPKNIVLYADDDPDDLKLVQDAFLRYAGNVEIITARDGLEAISYLNSLSESDPSPCLIILDINMPRMDGKQTLYTIRKTEQLKDVPVVLFTTSSNPLDFHFATRYKASFITKPIDYSQMDRIADLFLEHCTEEIKGKIQAIK